jgi:hypothetical protein
MNAERRGLSWFMRKPHKPRQKRPDSLTEKRSASGYRCVMPLRRGKSIMLTHEDKLTREEASALTGEYSAHAGKNSMLTQVKA